MEGEPPIIRPLSTLDLSRESQSGLFHLRSNGYLKITRKSGQTLTKNSTIWSKSRNFNMYISMFSVIWFLSLLPQAWGFYPSECLEGFYGTSENCLPCDSSCRTCTDPTSCSTCEDYMHLNATSGLCEKCTNGDYYDPFADLCRSCDSHCTGECASRTECFECAPGEIYDLEQMTCVSTCDPSKQLITSTQMNLGSICKTLEIYVDPFSELNIELGTLAYPYRSFKAAASEIVNHYSHSEAEITLYIKDGYIELTTFYFLNITSIKITNHPDYQLMNRKASVVLTKTPQLGISPKAHFHLLKNTNINSSSEISNGDFQEVELGELSKTDTGFICARSNIEISNLNFHSSEAQFFLVPIYLQHREMKLVDLDFNLTGRAIVNVSPMKVNMTNIIVDVSRPGRFFRQNPVYCNYPEAVLNNTITVNNLKPRISLQKPSYSHTLFVSALPGNYSIFDVDCGQLPIGGDIESICVNTSPDFECNPDDDLLQILSVDTVNFDGFPQDSGTGFTFTAPVIASLAQYRPILNNLTNFEFHNIKQNWAFGYVYIWGSGTQNTFLSNFKMENVSCTLFLVQVLNMKNLEVKNFTVENSLSHPVEILTVTSSGDISISDFTVENYKNEGFPTSPFLYLQLPNTSSVTLQNFKFENLSISDTSMIFINSAPLFATLEDFSFKNVVSPEELPMFQFQTLNSFCLERMTFENVHSSSTIDSNARIVDIVNLNLETMNNADFIDFKMIDVSLTLFKVGTLAEIPSESRNLSFKNTQFVNCTIPTPRSLISTNDFSGNINLNLKFDQLEFENVLFQTGGILVEMKHQLPTVIEILNSNFEGINSGSIEVEGSRISTDLSTKIAIRNTTFSEIQAPLVPFITITQNSNLDIEDSLFKGFTSLNLISGILRSFDGSAVEISNSRFENNSAIISPLFRVENEANAIVSNCTVTSNFGITNGIFEIASSGVLKILDSKIYNNYAIEKILGTIFLSFEASTISNTEIYSNEPITKSQIPTEISSLCSKLCFLHENMKNYLRDIDLSSITESDSLLQVLQGELDIINNTKIHFQSLVLSGFSSTIRIEDTRLSEIVFTKTPIDLISTTITVSNLTILNSRRENLEDDISFIQITSGDLVAQSVNYEDGNSRLFQLLSSNFTLNGANFTDVVNTTELISALSCTLFVLSDITFMDSEITRDSLFRIQKTSNVELRDIELSNLQSRLANIYESNVDLIQNLRIESSRQAFLFEDSVITEMTNSSFINNTETGITKGGSIQIQNSQLKITNTTFSKNTAYDGGAISFECKSLDNCNLVVENCTISNNTAQRQGGGIYYNYNYPRLSEIIHEGNQAQYGHNLASYPVRIGRIGSNPEDDLTIKDAGSGILFEETLDFALFDNNNQIMNLDNSNQIIILPKNSSISSIKGTNVDVVDEGIARFTSISTVVAAGIKNGAFTINSKALDQEKIQAVLGSNYAQKDIEVTFRDCQPGEQVVGDECEVCAAGTYSVNINSPNCTKCDLDADCLGGKEVSVRSGYWRRYLNSTKIVKCINAKACLGGFAENQESPTNCEEGYTGKLCSQCMVTKDAKYEKVNSYECSKCPNHILNAIQVFGTALLIFGFYMLLVIINVRKTTESQNSVLLRILTNYFQLITVSVSMNSDYPSVLFTLLIPAQSFGGSADSFLSFDCFVQDYEIKGPFESNTVLKLFLLSLLPIILFLIIALIWVIVRFLKPKLVKNLTRNLVISFISTVYLLHPKLTQQSFGFFKCVSIDDELQVVKADTDIECHSETHIKWLLIIAVPTILIWVIACPLAALILIYKGVRDKKSNALKDYFLILYQGLKPEAIYWEFVNTMRKIVILFSLLFSQYISIYISVSTLVITARLQILLKPYKNPEHYKVEFLAMMAGVVTIMTSLAYIQNGDNSNLDAFIFIIMVLVNIKFLLEWFYLIFSTNNKSNSCFRVGAIFLEKILFKRKSSISLSTKSQKTKSDNISPTKDPIKHSSSSISIPKDQTQESPRKSSRKIIIPKKISYGVTQKSTLREIAKDPYLTNKKKVKIKGKKKRKNLKRKFIMKKDRDWDDKSSDMVEIPNTTERRLRVTISSKRTEESKRYNDTPFEVDMVTKFDRHLFE